MGVETEPTRDVHPDTLTLREWLTKLLRAFHRLTQNRLQIESLDIVEGNELLMSFAHVTARKDDDELDVVMADALRLDEDGRVVEF